MALLRWLIDNPPPVRTPARFVLHVLAVHCNADGACYVKQRTIQASTGLAERTVRNALAELYAADVVSRVPYLRPKAGGQGANTYYINPDLIRAAVESPGNAALATTSPAPDAALVGAVTSEGRQELPGAKGGTRCRPEEKVVREEISSGSLSSSDEEPEAFTALMDGITLFGKGRKEVQDAWVKEQERVVACVASFLNRTDADGPGLLLAMIRDGDLPKFSLEDLEKEQILAGLRARDW